MELVEYLGAWNIKKIVEAGGKEAWEVLSAAEQTVWDKKLMSDIVTVLGKEAYDALNSTERRSLDLFIWAGCYMHKDLNSFRGGNIEMMLEWPQLGLPGPILLANKDNAALLQNVLDPAHPKDTILTDDQLHTFKSTHGGAKAAALVSAIFNNKDDKKGQADKHVDLMTCALKRQHHWFLDMSNTRFGSHGDVARCVDDLPHFPFPDDLSHQTDLPHA
jgi:hypothetical protein